MKKLIGTLLVVSAAFFSCVKFTGDPGTDPISTIRQREQNNNPGKPGQTPDPTIFADSLNNVKGSLSMQLAMDSVNTDQIKLSFDPNAQTVYAPAVDVPAPQSSGKISIAWISSDNIPLSTYMMPLTPAGIKIPLRVNAQSDGVYSLNLQGLQSVPLPYDLWLMDGYKKDSLELRYNYSYAFDIYKADTGSFGANRFKLVIRLR